MNLTIINPETRSTNTFKIPETGIRILFTGNIFSTQ